MNLKSTKKEMKIYIATEIKQTNIVLYKKCNPVQYIALRM
jgi:hypothetical protein